MNATKQQNRLMYEGDWHVSVGKSFILNPNYSIQAKMLYIAIQCYCGPDGWVSFPGPSVISSALGFRRKEFFKYADELKRHGLLSVIPETIS